MKEMYIILCTLGWTWTVFVFALLGYKHLRNRPQNETGSIGAGSGKDDVS
ncbi:MAG TPA: hypothetical protein VFE47_30390 [Tepidisphaeraceae bacterium]|jgi:hypothetical protein|nr:hypothetical protein [Tepidisphaeraceae bacterium]